MKPSFALDFRDGLVTLLHRTSRGWSQVGSTALDAPDFAEALGYLRATALGLSPRGITTKLVIPNEQVLYTQVHAPAPEPAKRRRQIKAALEGLTPYAVDDLVYDWTGTGADLQVAVIARETLAEAEAFATEHRFNPVSFVAVPDNGAYPSEPFFGQSALSTTLLAEGEKVERDTDPVAVIARDFPRSEPVVPPVAAPPVAEPPPQASKPEATIPVAAEPVATPAAPVEPTESVPSPSRWVAPEPPEPANPRVTLPDPAPRMAPLSNPLPPKPAPDMRPMAAKPAIDVPEAPMALDVDVAADSDAGAEAASRTAVQDKIPPSPAAEIVAAFASRRSAAIAAATAGNVKPTGAVPGKIPSAGSAPSASPGMGASGMGGLGMGGPGLGGQTPVQRPAAARPNLARPAASAARDPLPFPIKGSSAVAKPAAAKPGKTTGAAVTAPGILGARRERNVVPLLPTASSAEGQDAARRTGSKSSLGLGSRDLPAEGKPRYLGLILTAILLLLLAAVAAWSSFFMGANDTTGAGSAPATTQSRLSPTAVPASSDTTATVSATPEIAAITAETPAPTASEPATQTAALDPAARTGDQTNAADIAANQTSADQATADQTAADQTAAAKAAADQVAASQTAADQAATDQTTLDQSTDQTTASQTPADQAAVAQSAVAPTPILAAPEPAPKTEVSTVAEPLTSAPDAQQTGAQDQIVLASADQAPTLSVPLALPIVAAGADAGPAAEPPPPSYGTVYKFDADGRIVPTPEGIVTPEGVLLIAGKPKLAPPDRPADLTPVAAAPSVVTAPNDPATTSTTASATATTDAISTAIAAATATPAAQPATPDAATTAAAAAPATPAATPSASTATDPTAGTSTTSAAAPAAETAPPVLPPDPSLKGKHPKDRPADLTPPAGQQGLATGADATDTRVAGLHPQGRPDDLPEAPSPLAADTGADAAAASASLASNGMALMTSPIPAKRPSGLDRAVDTAVAAALSQPATKQPAAKATPILQMAASSNAAPEAQAEPDSEAPAPNLPTNANVAKQATTKNALNTNRVALLAVFGTPSTRFAMIRQSNGAVKKVQVGDSMDGGRIAAITATSVQYQKGGQMVTLSLPTG